jgi:glycosyltransferase involved in cell wall biosynthesis
MIQIPVKKVCHKIFRSCVHPVLLHYGSTLRKVYHSSLGHAIFQSKGRLGIMASRIKRLIFNQNKVLKLPALLKLGFQERALADLEKIVSSSTVKAERIIASWELSVAYCNSTTVVDAQKALKHLDFILKFEKNKQRIKQAVVLKSECLERLGRLKEAFDFIQTALKQVRHEDFYLALANLLAMESTASKEELDQKRLSLINQVMEKYKLESLCVVRQEKGLVLDNLCVPDCSSRQRIEDPLVTVIMPAYNAQETISTALSSLLSQTWQNMEIIVVDDASTDETLDIVKGFAEQDSRVQVIQRSENLGPYIGRNLALSQAKGDFVTVNDADDWAHPRKIEIQVQDLLANPGVIANLSRCTRVDSSMIFKRRGNPGSYLAINLSSLMFRRKLVLQQAGYWDCVRFAGDSEFLKRLKKVFGEAAVQKLQTGPLAFARQDESSLTGDNRFGYPGFFMGARKAYVESYNWWHGKESPYMNFPQQKRLFPIAAPMDPFIYRNHKTNKIYLDVVIATEFRLTGGTIASTIEEIKVHQAMGLQTGIMPLYRFDLDPVKAWNGKILDLINSDNVHLIVYGQEVYCDLLIVRHPPILQEYQEYLPMVKARKVKVIVNQAQFRDYHDPDSRLYDLSQCRKNMERYFGHPGIWHPIGPAVRKTLIQDHQAHTLINIDEEDWVNIIDVKYWSINKARHSNSIPVIGRHSRDQYVKWPSDRNELLAAYPADNAFEVKILGGADTPKNILGFIPENWTVYAYDALPPREFLAEIDVFVYFTHPGLVEAFGRTPLEAMAAGIPVILPEKFKQVFRDGAIYATPFDVQSIVMQLHQDKASYQRQSEVGRKFVELHFGHEKHKKRLAPYLQKF